MSELFELCEYVLGPGEPFEVLERFVVLCVEALLYCFVHGGDFLFIVLQKLILEGP